MPEASAVHQEMINNKQLSSSDMDMFSEPPEEIPPPFRPSDCNFDHPIDTDMSGQTFQSIYSSAKGHKEKVYGSSWHR